MRNRMLIAVLTALSLLTGSGPAGAEPIELLRDLSFKAPISVGGAEASDGKPIARVGTPGAEGEPVWRIAQWSTKRPDLGLPRNSGNETCWQNTMKVICVPSRASRGTGFSLVMNADREWGPLRRPPGGTKWPHLLLAQTIDPAATPPLSKARSLVFETDFTIETKNETRGVGYNPRLHAMQLIATLIVQNRDKASPGFGQYLWFVMPLYDSRYEWQKHGSKLDTGRSKFLWIVEQRKVMSVSSQKSPPGTPIRVRFDALEEIKSALSAA
ncbi:MAG: hypothetical protein AB7O57_15055, partial [Hyphomicrobiaceae bacterium]